MLYIRKWNKNLVISAVYFNKKEDKYYLKRFPADTPNKKIDFIPDESDVKVIGISIDYLPQISVTYRKKKAEEDSVEIIPVAEFVEIMTFRARGKRINFPGIKSIKFIEPLPYEEPEEETEEDEMEETDDIGTENIENVDDAIAKEIFLSDPQPSKPDPNKMDEEGVQLSIFDE